MNLRDFERALEENANQRTFVLAFPPKIGWDLTPGARNTILFGLDGHVLYVMPPLVYFEVDVKIAKRWYLHVAASVRNAAKRA